MSFKTKLQIEHIERTVKYKLLSDLVYEKEDGTLHITHKDFGTDGQSIPKWLRSIVGSPFATKHPRPAVYHDDLLENYVYKGLMTHFEAASEYSKAQKSDGENVAWRKVKWTGVRLGDYWHILKNKFRRKK